MLDQKDIDQARDQGTRRHTLFDAYCFSLDAYSFFLGNYASKATATTNNQRSIVLTTLEKDEKKETNKQANQEKQQEKPSKKEGTKSSITKKQ